MNEDPEDNEGRGLWVGPIILAGLIVSLVTFASCARAETIRHDMGGSVSARLDQMQHMSGVRIVGRCYSACTMLLGLPDTCVTRNARLGFHGPSTRSGLPLPHSEWERVSNVMADQYPPALRLWFLREGRMNTGPVRVIRGAELINMGVKECRK